MSKAITGSLLVLTLLVWLPGCSKEAPAPQAPAAVAKDAPPAQSHPVPDAAYTAVDLAGIAKAPGGQTVADVFAKKDELAGKQITVRGKVVKARANIMGKNWIHVRDGSGTDNANDLTVTTTETPPTVGATVVVTGVLSRNKDLGLGYKYDVLIEDAKVKTE